MKRPHEQFALPMSFGRKLGASRQAAWLALLCGATLFSVSVYIYQVNAAASKGFALRTLEKQLSQDQEAVAELEDQASSLQAMDTLQARVASLGYVPADQLEYIDANHQAYAFAK